MSQQKTTKMSQRKKNSPQQKHLENLSFEKVIKSKLHCQLSLVWFRLRIHDRLETRGYNRTVNNQLTFYIQNFTILHQVLEFIIGKTSKNMEFCLNIYCQRIYATYSYPRHATITTSCYWLYSTTVGCFNDVGASGCDRIRSVPTTVLL